MTSSTTKITEWVKPGDTSGEFRRQVSTFRNWVSSEPDAEFPAEKDRYHLYISYACPWAHRTLITRRLKGLEDVISVSAVHWHMGSNGWRFVTADEKLPGENVIPDPVAGHSDYKFIRDVYFGTEPGYTGRFTVPVLYDKIKQRIVNNESSEILRMLNTAFNNVVAPEFRSVDVYPEADEKLRARIDEANEWTYDLINNGVYKSGFATTQEAYERNVTALFGALDRTEKHLEAARTEGPYYFGKVLTEADIRLFVTIVRFDPVYVQHFKCNIRDIRSGYPRIHAWMRNLYWNHAAFRETTQFEHIKKHYTMSHPQINPHSIVPVGPVPDILAMDEEVTVVGATPPFPTTDDGSQTAAALIHQHGHRDLVQAVSFNSYGDRCATGSADGKIRVFNRQRDGMWRLCDTWGAHGGEVLELQWLPTSIYPSLIASLGIDGHFKIWAEDPTVGPGTGRRFSASRGNQRAAYETRSPRAPYRSFSMRHDDETRHTHLALLSADGELSLFEYETPENMGACVLLDEVRVCAKPLRGEEVAFRVAFDPNPLPCYAAIRAGASADSLGLVVAAMEAVKVYRTRDVHKSTMGATQLQKALYLAAEVDGGQRGSLIRDVAWAWGNIRGYDIIATACQDGCVRVLRLDTPLLADDGKSWAFSDVMRRAGGGSSTQSGAAPGAATAAGSALGSAVPGAPAATGSNNQHSGLAASLARAGSNLSAAVSSGSTGNNGIGTGSGSGSGNGSGNGGSGGGAANKEPEEGAIRHTLKEVSKLDHHHAPVWRVGFDDDGQVLGSVGDAGKLICFRQLPNGLWAKSSELKMERR
ncbi:Glutathione S-transferase omega-like 2 [Ceratocystis fimbriata CBS 114723]|uniref:Glutathione S-transferase omega-like 2 n=1 Tax=Ceratocystis fimbriata CBS 114723 TaxID=1035309 RepID=A0A2C5XI44_9PEZI|nr:Glutathione S-transferase omega-like 2 [Ceratocystis fimbriata CBS 114723]